MQKELDDLVRSGSALSIPFQCPWIQRTERIERYMEFKEVTTSDVFLWAYVYHFPVLKRPVGCFSESQRFRAAVVEVSRGTVTFVF